MATPASRFVVVATLALALSMHAREDSAAQTTARLAAYRPVTSERLLKPGDGDWLMIRRTYDGWGYSPLDQITPANVAPAAAGVGASRPASTTATRRRRSSTTA